MTHQGRQSAIGSTVADVQHSGGHAVNSTPVLTNLLQCWSVFSALLLLTATYPLWLPGWQAGFPQVPLLDALAEAGPVWDGIAVAGLGLSLLVVLGTTGRDLVSQLRKDRSAARRCGLAADGWIGALVCGLVLVALNQHRLQAWFYQLLLLSLVFSLADARWRLRWLQWLTISIYAYSAMGKLDFQFLHTVGHDMLVAGLAPWGLQPDQWPPANRVAVATVIPLVELGLATSLWWNRSRRWAGWAACGFHLLLIWLLGWQLKHSWGVVLWNVQFAVQALLLFALPRWSPPGWSSGDGEHGADLSPGERAKGWRQWWSYGCIGPLTLALVLPLTERFGYWDHWPSWALYAPHSSRVQVWVSPSAFGTLPLELRELLETTGQEEYAGYRLPLADWSLRTLGAPIYPQARFQLGVTRQLAQLVGNPQAIRAQLRGVADRWDGQRSIRSLENGNQIHQASQYFWLGSQPRSVSPAQHESVPRTTGIR